ncbi:MAG: 50S ribosomal protein L4 [Selenomonadaceae bacterium]|nr:50S ribosomal protein L4 [Selenomonadaceae bacterium]MBR1858752.1 50S ribosomal protein L4 [Selenomonadaceae bacterium]
MPTVSVYNMTNEKVGDMELSEQIFDVEMNVGLVHQVVVMQLASQRLGTHSTKTRSMVRGGGRKPWRQKGTGRARAGSRRSPLWRGGGTVFGPHPRSYAFTMPRKQRRLALKCVLSDKLKSGDLIVLDNLDFEAPKTKQFVKLLNDFKIEKKALFIMNEVKENVKRSANNLQGIKTIGALGLNVYDILYHDKLFLTKDAVAKIEEVFV